MRQSSEHSVLSELLYFPSPWWEKFLNKVEERGTEWEEVHQNPVMGHKPNLDDGLMETGWCPQPLLTLLFSSQLFLPQPHSSSLFSLWLLASSKSSSFHCKKCKIVLCSGYIDHLISNWWFMRCTFNLFQKTDWSMVDLSICNRYSNMRGYTGSNAHV